MHENVEKGIWEFCDFECVNMCEHVWTRLCEGEQVWEMCMFEGILVHANVYEHVSITTDMFEWLYVCVFEELRRVCGSKEKRNFWVIQ